MTLGNGQDISMKKIILALIIMILAGCTVELETVTKANELCKQFGGLDHYHLTGWAHCVDGTEVSQ